MPLSTTDAATFINDYVAEINKKYQSGLASELSLRSPLENLLNHLLPKHQIVNEPTQQDCGKPDLIITRNNLPTAFIETKQLFDSDLDGRTKHKEQFDRYKAALETIVFTDYLDFHLYQQASDQAVKVCIAEENNGKIISLPNNYNAFLAIVSRLADAEALPITSADKLAAQMAAKARLLRDTIRAVFNNDKAENTENGKLYYFFKAFKNALLHDLTTDKFADIYAQTIVYGLFAARLHDPTPDTFTREEAATLIPISNPFLREIFQQIAGNDLDSRISWIFDDLVATFRATNMERIMREYGKNKQQRDPLMHFYENFLEAYDPQARKDLGVFYTPQSVVHYIVDAVDTILRKDFGLAQGLADASMVKHKVANVQKVKPSEADTLTVNTHRVQILDPATGTGTFLAEVINLIHQRYFADNQGMWQSYVDSHLLPRVHGFEIMMASYAIAHLKMDITLRNTGYEQSNNSGRFGIYLTNTLEEPEDNPNLFSYALAIEAQNASRIKRDTPVMVMLGNPPYNSSSANKGTWILNLIDDYKYKDKGLLTEEYFKEVKHWLGDDYVKFLRYGEYMIKKNETGILAFINNHSFLDNVTFRFMRYHLLQTFDDIYIYDLHGNNKKKETSPDGSKDENIFLIQQGVSINIFVKNSKKKQGELAVVHHANLYGKQKAKYAALTDIDFEHTQWKTITPVYPYYFFVPKDFSAQEYETGFSLVELFTQYDGGIISMGDDFAFAESKQEIITRLQKLTAQQYTNESLKKEFSLGKNYPSFVLSKSRKLVIKEELIRKIYYRPFTTKYTYYDSKILARPHYKTLSNMIQNNIGIVFKRGFVANTAPCFITDTISDFRYWSCSGMQGGDFVAPLYLYLEEDGSFDTERKVNFEETIYKQICEGIGQTTETTDPEEVFDYIYAVLHSPHYRETYKEFLKIDFPRVPYPTDAALFHALAAKGRELRELHLLHNADNWATGVTYPVAGDNIIEKARYDADNQRVYINATQYFGNVPSVSWEHFIGGYQPCQKWLKDRKERTLDFADINHYKHIVHALRETARIMQEIDALAHK